MRRMRPVLLSLSLLLLYVPNAEAQSRSSLKGDRRASPRAKKIDTRNRKARKVPKNRSVRSRSKRKLPEFKGQLLLNQSTSWTQTKNFSKATITGTKTHIANRMMQLYTKGPTTRNSSSITFKFSGPVASAKKRIICEFNKKTNYKFYAVTSNPKTRQWVDQSSTVKDKFIHIEWVTSASSLKVYFDVKLPRNAPTGRRGLNFGEIEGCFIKPF